MYAKLLSFILFIAITLSSGWTMAAEVLKEVVVTATKRASNLQDVTISVGVITDVFIVNFQIKNISDAQNFVPGLQVQQTFGSWALRIRGLNPSLTCRCTLGLVTRRVSGREKFSPRV